MICLNKNINVEPIEDGGVISSSDEYTKVKVLGFASEIELEYLEIGSEMVAAFVRKFKVDGKDMYFVKEEDVVAIL